jgi:autotransporter-associated beta strand protein
MVEIKVGTVRFTHKQNFSGDVEITRGALKVNVPFEALEKLVSEKVRVQLIEKIEQMKPHEILALAVPKK